MSSNLPPGVTESMIPGNRPEDLAYEVAIDELVNECVEYNLEPEEMKIMATVGLRAVSALRFRLAAETSERNKIDRENDQHLTTVLTGCYKQLKQFHEQYDFEFHSINQILIDLKETGYVEDSKCQLES